MRGRVKLLLGNRQSFQAVHGLQKVFEVCNQRFCLQEQMNSLPRHLMLGGHPVRPCSPTILIPLEGWREFQSPALVLQGWTGNHQATIRMADVDGVQAGLRGQGSQHDRDNLMVRIEQKYVGYIVGTSGSTIKRVSQQMSVKLHFDQSTYEQGYSTLHIVGMPEAVQRAKAEIDNLMTRCDARIRREESRSVGARSRSPSVTSCGTASRRSASKCSQVSGSTSFQGSDCEASATVRVEAKFMGPREYEVSIVVKNPQTNEGLGKFCIFGDADSVKQAKARIQEIVKMYGQGDDKYIQRGRLRECASSDSSRAASPASWSGSDNGSCSGTGIGWENTKSQWQSKRGGWSRASQAPSAPCSNLRAKLKYLIGRWYCNQQCFEVQLDSRGDLSCTSWRLNEKSDEAGSRQPRPIYYEGRDIFLGERCRYFLNSLSTAYVTWEDEQRPGIKLRWSSWKSLKTPSRGVGQVGTGKAQRKSYTGYAYSGTSKEAFRMTASDFPALG
eukprot:symbB.v1.2.016842.t1/scaffold1278.1/size127201/11